MLGTPSSARRKARRAAQRPQSLRKDKKGKKDKDKKTKKKRAKNQVENHFKLLAYLLVVGVLGKVPIISTAADGPTTPTELASDIPALRAAAPALIGWVERTLTLDTTNLSLGEGAIVGTGAADGVYFHRCVLWLQKHEWYKGCEKECFGVVRIILHQLWVPDAVVLFVLALHAAFQEPLEIVPSPAAQRKPRVLALSRAAHALLRSATTRRGARTTWLGAAPMTPR
jgi:hypothetical protein